MFKLAYSTAESATGKVKEIYDAFPPHVGVPITMQLFSASPDALALQIDSITYFMHHDELEAPLLAAIRFIAANELQYSYCTELNRSMLLRAGVTEKQLQSLLDDMQDVPFEEHEVTLLRLVRKVMRAPQSVTTEDVAACRTGGWSDKAIFDASLQAARMSVYPRLMAAFKA